MTLAALPAQRRPAAGSVLVVVGVAALLARPLLVRAVDDPRAALVVLFVTLGLAGVCWPLALPARPAPGAAALVLGIAVFAAGRLFGGLAAPAFPAPVVPLLLNTLAAVAEEAFFRRLVYGLLEPHGTAVAVAGSAACFAAVHFTVWGAAVLPLDLAAGLFLSWQRAVTGRWSVPAVTHVAANVLAVL